MAGFGDLLVGLESFEEKAAPCSTLMMELTGLIVPVFRKKQTYRHKTKCEERFLSPSKAAWQRRLASIRLLLLTHSVTVDFGLDWRGDSP